MDDHFRFDLKTGVYARAEALDFYAIGGGAAGNLRPVKLFIAPAKPPIAANSVK